MASKRLDCINGLVAALQAIDGTGNYTFDLSGSGVVSTGLDTVETRLAGVAQATLRVQEGPEERARSFATSTQAVGRLILDVDAVLRDNAAAPLVEQLNDLLADVGRAVGADPTLGGTCRQARVAQIGAPSYDTRKRAGHVSVGVGVEYVFDEAADL